MPTADKLELEDAVDQKDARIMRLAVEIYIAKAANPALISSLMQEKGMQVQAKYAIQAAKVFVKEWEAR